MSFGARASFLEGSRLGIFGLGGLYRKSGMLSKHVSLFGGS